MLCDFLACKRLTTTSRELPQLRVAFGTTWACGKPVFVVGDRMRPLPAQLLLGPRRASLRLVERVQPHPDRRNGTSGPMGCPFCTAEPGSHPGAGGIRYRGFSALLDGECLRRVDVGDEQVDQACVQRGSQCLDLRMRRRARP
jgi:hypothetical protein